MPIRTLEISGTRIRIREADGPPARRLPAVVFACDPPNVLEMYGPLFAAFKKHTRVVAFEAPGFAQSKGKRVPYDLASQADWTARLLAKLDLGPALLAFPCVSAYVALELAAARPDLVAGAVLEQAPAWTQMRAWVERVDKNGILRTRGVGQAVMWARRERVAEDWYHAALPIQCDSKAFGGLAVEALYHGGKFPLATAFQQLFAADQSGPARPLPADAPPILAIWGAADRSHGPSEPDSLLKHAPAARLVRFDEAGHFPALEAPARYVDTVLSWWDSVQTAPPSA